MTDYERDLAAGFRPAQSDYERDMAAGWKPTAAPKDMGPDARRPVAAGMRPPVAPDDVELADVAGDYGKRDVRKTIQGRQDLVTLPGAQQQRDERAAAVDPIKNDPLAGMILQSAPSIAVGGGVGMLGKAAGAAPWLTRMASGAGGGAAATPDSPGTGALLGALPGVPAAAVAADRAIGAKALEIATAPAKATSSHTLSKAIGGAIGATAGHAVGGPVGAFMGAGIGAGARDTVARLGDKAASALAARYLRQGDVAAASEVLDKLLAGPAETGRKTIPAAEVPRIFGPDVAAPPPARAPLAPLTPTAAHESPLHEGMFPEHFAPKPFLDEISGQPVTNAGKYIPTANLDTSGPATMPGKPNPLAADVARDAKANLSAPVEEGQGPVADVLGKQLAESVRMLDELSAAKGAGKLTPEMAREAVKAGLPPHIVSKITGYPKVQLSN